MEPEAPRAAKARDRVLRAAMDIIVERGLDRLRLAEIARRTSMSEGHVLYYFGTKDQILIDTLVWSESRLTDRRRKAIAATDPGWDQLCVFVEQYLPKDYRDPVWALWVEAWARRHVEGRTAPLRQTAEVWEADLLAVLERGAAAGMFGPVPATFVKRLIALMNGFAVEILERVIRRPEVLDAVLEHCRLELDVSTPDGSRARDGKQSKTRPSATRR
jgi:AcrR family transcriptional regulator